jgi:menaquinone-specific isochorismate synthase
LEIGGIGIADSLKGSDTIDYKELFECMEDRLSVDNPNLRYYGGMRFDQTPRDDHWHEFGAYQFIVPQFELLQTPGQTIFAFNFSLNEINKNNIESILYNLEQLNFSSQTTYRKVPQILSRSDHPNASEWASAFKEVAKDIDALKYEKIVLARKSVFDFDVSLRPDALMKHLKDTTPNCYHFCFQFSAHSAFLGATPERLYRRNVEPIPSMSTIQSEAIAGTRPRGFDAHQDQNLEKQLLSSSKDADEHKYVIDSIVASLEPLCSALHSDESFQLRKLQGSQHLVTHVEGRLKEGIDDQQILQALHPTPAVAGFPVKAALEAIRTKEPFDRGWYAGPVGYVGYDQSEFVVAIRSGLIHGNQLSLYAGAGIVNGSKVHDEWNEIENKISNFIKVFEKEP